MEPIRDRNDRGRNRRTHEVPFIASRSHFTRKNKVSCSGLLPKTKPIEHSCSHYNAFRSITWLTRISLRTWEHQMTTIMQPFQWDLQPEIQETHRTTHTGTTTRCKTHKWNQFATETTVAATAAHTRYLSSPAAATLHGKYKVSCCGFLPKTKPMQHSCSHSNGICNQRFKKRIELRTLEQPLVAEHRGGTNSRMKRPQPHPAHTQGTFHRRLQPLYTEKRKVSCSGFLPKASHMQHSCSHYNAFRSIPLQYVSQHSLHHHFPSSPLPFVITSLRHHFPSSPLPFVITSLCHPFPSSPLPFVTTSLRHHFPSSPLPIVTTSHRRHLPSSPLPFITTSYRHHLPSSPPPFLTTPLHHHFPSSPLPFLTTSHRHHLPSSPPPFLTPPLHHHFPSSPLPFLTTSHRHHLPSSPPPFLTTPLHHHFPPSPLPFITTSHRHHFPSSPLPFITTSLRHHPVS